MKSNLQLVAVLLMALAISSCKKEEEPDQPVDVSYPSGTLDLGATVSADFFGRVINENGNPVVSADIQIGTASTTTDENGVFKIDQAPVPGKLAFIKAQKSGYFIGAKSIIPDQTSLNFVQITMHTKQLITTAVTGDPINVTVQNGVNVTLPSRLTDQAGMAYHGQVKVYAKHISPESVDIDQMPGSAYGQGADEIERFFEMYGMILIELESFTGQPLKLYPGEVATLKIRVSNSQISDAPSGIPLLYFDESKGYWVEDGWATLEQDQYVATVSHLDHWSCGKAYSVAEVQGDVQNHLGDSLANFVIQINSPNGNSQTYTSSNGTFRTYVPADITIDWAVLDECGSATAISSIGPYAAGNPYNESIQIPNGAVDLAKQYGDLLDCNISSVTNGYVIMTVGGTDYLQYTANGSFAVHLVNCESVNNYEIIGYDMNTGEESIVNLKSLSSYNNYTGNILACSSASEYISFTVDGGSPMIYTANINCVKADTGGGPFFKIYPDDMSIVLWGQVFTPGGYDYYANVQPNTIWVHPADFNQFGGFSIHTELVEWSNAVGGTVSITFSGFYTDPALNQHDLSGDLVVFRDS